MAGLREGDKSLLADALILAGLFLPFFPIVAIAYTGAAIALLGCAADQALACSLAGIDFNVLHQDAAALLHWSAKTGASSGALLFYICTLFLLVQLSTEGFRSRVVRTCAVIMWVGLLPLVLGIADVFVRTPELVCGGVPCTLRTMAPSLANLGHIFIRWITNTAVPLGVLTSLLVAITMAYHLLVVRFVRLIWNRD